MGLPINYRELWKTDNKASAKTDPTAPARSAIRRQRTIRHAPSVGPRPSLPSSTGSYRSSSNNGRSGLRADRQSLHEEIRRREGAPNRGLTATVSRDAFEGDPTQSSNLYAHAADVVRIEASQRHRLDGGQALLRDAMSYEPRSERSRIGRNSTVPPTPEAFHSTHRSYPSLALNTDESMREYSTSPYEHLVQGPTAASTAQAPLTSRFAPAYRLSDEAGDLPAISAQDLADRARSLSILSERIPIVRDANQDVNIRMNLNELLRHVEAIRNSDSSRLTIFNIRPEADYLLSAGLRLNMIPESGSDPAFAEALETLRRLYCRCRERSSVERSNRPSVSTEYRRELDGLGDRERSFSPDPDYDTWETLLLTIPYDERVPNSHSSFSSNTASAPSTSLHSFDSSAASASSQRTVLTAPSTIASTGTSLENESCPVDNSEFDEDNENPYPNTSGDEGQRRSTAIADLDRRAAQLAYISRNTPSFSRAFVDDINNPPISASTFTFSPAHDGLPTAERATNPSLESSRRSSEVRRAHDQLLDISHRLEIHREQFGDTARYRRLLEREQELRRLDLDLRRLESQIASDRNPATTVAMTATADHNRQRPEERL